MHKLLYYPNFEIQNQNFLKFALLYIDEIRPIIPEIARDSIGASMKSIMRNTELINPYSPKYENGRLASFAMIKYLEEKKLFDKYGEGIEKRNHNFYNYTLYADKYTYEFENYCLENGMGRRCNEGILLNADVAYSYMSILAEIISKDTNMYKIPLDEFINLRSDYKFEMARKDFVSELNRALDLYDANAREIDLYDIRECAREVSGLLREIFISCAAVMVGIHSFGNMCAADKGNLDFWGSVGNVGLSLDTLKQHSYEARELANRIRSKKQARKYLTKVQAIGYRASFSVQGNNRKFYQIADTNDIVYIGTDLPDEYAHSNYTHILKGANAKAKANAVQGLPQLIEIATGKHFKENHKEKHVTDAGLGWYRYEARFALPIFDEAGEVERYNVFHAALLRVCEENSVNSNLL